ncbi:MAG: hypothetical protein HY914_14515 [Desulfomonile tiedjei]|nr:hypothetical protein [Desulfomonile tiedjei]
MKELLWLTWNYPALAYWALCEGFIWDCALFCGFPGYYSERENMTTITARLHGVALFLTDYCKLEWRWVDGWQPGIKAARYALDEGKRIAKEIKAIRKEVNKTYGLNLSDREVCELFDQEPDEIVETLSVALANKQAANA